MPRASSALRSAGWACILASLTPLVMGMLVDRASLVWLALLLLLVGISAVCWSYGLPVDDGAASDRKPRDG